jgi:hypothetical protein
MVSLKVTSVASELPPFVITTVYLSVSPPSAWLLLLLSVNSASVLVAVMTGTTGLATGVVVVADVLVVTLLMIRSPVSAAADRIASEVAGNRSAVRVMSAKTFLENWIL